MTYRVTLRKKLPMDDFKNGQNPSSRMCRRYFKRNLGWWRPIDSILIQARCALYVYFLLELVYEQNYNTFLYMYSYESYPNIEFGKN